MDAPYISKPVLGFFRYIVRGYFRRHFHAVRISNAVAFESLGSGPLIVYANHSSWWDPMVSILLAQTLLAYVLQTLESDGALAAETTELRAGLDQRIATLRRNDPDTSENVDDEMRRYAHHN